MTEPDPHLGIWTAHQVRNDQLTSDGNGAREKLAPDV